MTCQIENRKRRIAWFSPMRITGSCVTTSAYFSKMVIPDLSRLYDIEIFTDDSSTEFKNYLQSKNIHSSNPFDLFIYQLEDHKETDFVRMHLGIMPGVVFFHDFLFSRERPEPIHNSPWRLTVKTFEREQAKWADRKDDYRDLTPYGLREGALAFVPVFTSPFHHREFLRLTKESLSASLPGGTRSYYIPMPINRELFEHNQSFYSNIAIIGSPHVECRMHKILLALSRLKVPCNVQWLIDPLEKNQAEELVNEFKLSNVSLVVGRGPNSWREMIKKSGIAIHTRFSVFGHLAPYLEMSLAAGLICIGTDIGDGESYPDDILIKIRSGEGEDLEFQYLFEKLINNPDIDIAVKGKNFAKRRFDTSSIVHEIDTLISLEIERLKYGMERWREVEENGRKQLFKEVRSKIDNTLQGTSFDCNSVFGKCFQELGWL